MIRCTFFVFLVLIKSINAEETKGGMPQLNPESFISQVFWLTLLFAILFLLIHNVFIPKLEKIRNKRDNTIDEHLKEAKRINDSINFVIENMRKQLDEARNTQNTSIKKSFNENKEILELKVAEINEEFEKKKEKLEISIEENRNSILSKLPTLCVNLSDNLYEKIMGETKKGNLDEFNKSVGDSK